MGMMDYRQCKRFAEDRYEKAVIFSPQEKVAERVLDLLEAGHNVESVQRCLLDDVECLAREGDDERVKAIKAFLSFINGKP
ncbi:MAG TPA: hypothetical protein VHZ51_30710 [Ktedonobacteraceae bacterium]|jgi:hypothetical protein|nr:hypothetical protein [Ktedonobacteraceae bacterium]